MKQKNKWEKELERLSHFEEKATNKKLFKYYRSALILMKKEMKVFLKNYEKLSFSKRLEAERLLQNAKQIDKILRDTNAEVNNTIEKYVKQEAIFGYYGTWYALEGVNDIKLDMYMLPEKYIKELVHHPVKGKVFSKRLYKHRKKLAKEVTNSMLDAARKGKSYAVASKGIEEATESTYKQAIRIARTEGGRVQSKTTQKSYEEAEGLGIDIKKQWISTLDDRTRESHEEMDGQTVGIDEMFVSPDGDETEGPRLFGIAEEDIFCRCSTVTEVNGISPELRRDSTSGDVFDYKNFYDWMDSK